MKTQALPKASKRETPRKSQTYFTLAKWSRSVSLLRSCELTCPRSQNFPKRLHFFQNQNCWLRRTSYSSPCKMFWKTIFDVPLPSHPLPMWTHGIESLDSEAQEGSSPAQDRQSQLGARQDALMLDATTCPGYHPQLVENLGCHGNRGEWVVKMEEPSVQHPSPLRMCECVLMFGRLFQPLNENKW